MNHKPTTLDSDRKRPHEDDDNNKDAKRRSKATSLDAPGEAIAAIAAASTSKPTVHSTPQHTRAVVRGTSPSTAVPHGQASRSVVPPHFPPSDRDGLPLEATSDETAMGIPGPSSQVATPGRPDETMAERRQDPRRLRGPPLSGHGRAILNRIRYDDMGQLERLLDDFAEAQAQAAGEDTEDAEDNASFVLTYITKTISTLPKMAGSQDLKQRCRLEARGGQASTSQVIAFLQTRPERATMPNEPLDEVPTLRQSFYQTPYKGKIQHQLFDFLQKYEGKIAGSWTREREYQRAVLEEKQRQAQQAKAKRAQREAGQLPRRGEGSSSSSSSVQPSADAASDGYEISVPAVDLPDSSKVTWHARCLPVLQSSGMGKSRLLRELGLIGGRRSISVFVLCVRPEHAYDHACFPPVDEPIRTFLNSSNFLGGSAPLAWGTEVVWLRWKIKVACLLLAVWQASETLILQQGIAAWDDICDTDDTPKSRVRNAFLQEVANRAETSLEQRLQALGPLPGRGSQEADREILDATKKMLAAVTHEASQAAERFHRAQGRPWVVLGIDEASGICPPILVPHDRQRRSAEDESDRNEVRRKCLAALTGFFSMPSYEGNPAVPEPLQRFWLIYTDTNSAVSVLNPSASEDPSGRVQRYTLERVPAFCPVVLDLGAKEPGSAREALFRLSPMASSADHLLARFGRPLWESLVEVVADSKGQPSKSPDSSASLDGSQSSRHRHENSWTKGVVHAVSGETVRCYAHPDMVLKKLLRSVPGKDTFPDDNERLMALLYQRLALEVPTTKFVSDIQAKNIKKFYTDRVQHHGGTLLELSHRGDAVTVVTASEPLVTKAVTALFRTNGRNRHGRIILTNGGTPFPEDGLGVWSRAWTGFQEMAEGGLAVDEGEMGELAGQAFLLIAHDRAERRRVLAMNRFEFAYRGECAFVHLEDLLGQVARRPLSAGLEQLCATLPAHVWTNYQRFTRRFKTYQLSRQALIAAWEKREAIVGTLNQPVWDFVLPLYCGSLDEALDPAKFTWIQVQIKSRQGKRSKTEASSLVPQHVVYGDLLTAEEERRGLKPEHEYEPPIAPIMLWLEMSGPQVRPEGQPSNPPTPPRVEEGVHEGTKFWLIEFPMFSAQNHAALDALPPGSRLPHHLPNTGPTAGQEVEDYARAMQEQLDGSGEQTLFPARPPPQSSD